MSKSSLSGVDFSPTIAIEQTGHCLGYRF